LVREYLKNKNISYQAEVVVGDGKIDFYIENIGFVEVKGCSLIKEIN
jgi:DNA-binding sugar fermentation-stimulating protein